MLSSSTISAAGLSLRGWESLQNRGPRRMQVKPGAARKRNSTGDSTGLGFQEFLDEAKGLDLVHVHLNTEIGEWYSKTSMGDISYVDSESAAALNRDTKYEDKPRVYSKFHFYEHPVTGEIKMQTCLNWASYSDYVNNEGREWNACVVFSEGANKTTFNVKRVESAAFKELQDPFLEIPLYIIHLIDRFGSKSFSLTLQANPKTNEYHPHQLKTYRTLNKTYGPSIKFLNKS